MSSNVKQQIADKTETINVILRFIEGGKSDGLTVEQIENFLKGMKQSYREAYETLNRLPRN